MKTLGLTERTPRMLGSCRRKARRPSHGVRTGEAMRPMEPHTIADSIAVGSQNWKKAVLAVAESGGAMINASDEEILEAMRSTGRLTGIFAEPAAATAVAGLRRAGGGGHGRAPRQRGGDHHGERLEDVQSARPAVTQPFDITPDGDGLADILLRQELIS